MNTSISYGVGLSYFAVLLLLRLVYLIYWRLFLSPLARFPGSRLAAATGWYEFYYDFFHKGKYIFEIERMHGIYGKFPSQIRYQYSLSMRYQGPIVRVNPDELSIRDSTFYNDLYVTGSQRRSEHYDAFASGIDFEGIFPQVPADLHLSC